MRTDEQPGGPDNSAGPLLRAKDLAALLVKHYGLHEGLYALLVEFQIGMGHVGPSKEDRTPGAMIGLHGVGLAKATEPGPLVVDAAEVNPKKLRKSSAPKK